MRDDIETIVKSWFSARQRVHTSILRDLLIEIFRRRPSDLAFKGGTAIAFFYGSDRFSEDIDFSSSDIEGYTTIDDTLESFEKSYSYKILNAWEDDLYQRGSFRRYPLAFGYEGKKEINVTIDYSIGKCILGTDRRDLSNGYSAASVSVMKAEELLAEKVRIIYARQKARDLYDLHYLCTVLNTGIRLGVIADKLAEDPSLKGRKYSFSSFRKRIEGLKPYWNDLNGIVNNYSALKFDDMSAAVMAAFRNA